ncbi:hypothetical protein EDB81DRAFT_683377 [Dactylonectria macrodidyma]|uniref:Uncharacterized protein n=1 Tax=Dactylonectria macrodidyma TaxID=307937 RepID=A0A9P9FHE1_9HYPO|nr:hypothetical protein EDB81DRAFT_683377 [Dactylonectria macrodidyma]
MPPKTRSGGVPAPSRVYHSTPAQQQVQFPPRRKVVRTHGKQTRKKNAMGSARSLRQQTLTQIDFVSSFEEEHDPIAMDSSDGEGDNKGDENDDRDDDGDDDARIKEDEQPVSSGRKRRARTITAKSARAKRRRTLGEESDTEPVTKKEATNRRRTLGDLPTSSYHTQTLTQLLGRDPAHALCIKDSEDENEDENEDDENGGNEGGFEDWLQDPTSPTPRRHHQTSITPRTQRQIRFASPKPPRPEASTLSRDTDRQESVVPQTPAKRRRDEIPSSSQLSTPASLMMARYGAPGETPSPLKNKTSSVAGTTPRPILDSLPGKLTSPRRRARVIQDSLATASWGSGEVMPLQERAITSPIASLGGETAASVESSSLLDEMDTPTKPRRQRQSSELGDGSKMKTESGASPTPRKRASPRKAGKRVLLEIPDSDAEDEDFENNVNDENDGGGFVAGPETQRVMNQIASEEDEDDDEQEEGDENARPTTPTPASAARINQQDRAVTASSTASSRSRRRPLHSSPQLPPIASSQPTTLPPPSSSPPKPSRPLSSRLRKPLHHASAHASTQTQPLESQRVPATTLRGLPPPSARTDILLPLSPRTLADVLDGFSVCLVLPFRVPAQVVRFWLFDGELLRFMACADAGRLVRDGASSSSWRYTLPQVYELNNPVEHDDMREEGWVDGPIDRYAYLPPAIIGQLLWNLRHAIFSDEDEDVAAMADVQSHNPSQHEEEQEEEEEEEEQVQLLPSSSAPPPPSRGKIPAPTPTPSISVSQQVEAQIQSDMAQSTQAPTSDDILVPSTPESEHLRQFHLVPSSPTPTKASPRTAIKPPPSRLPPLNSHGASSYRASRPAINSRSTTGVRPSQATTASQSSTPEKPSSAAAANASRPLSFPQLQSSSSLVFHDDSPLHIPPGFPLAADDSQLLTKSQMLPDSLLRDDTMVPPEIWDSDDDGL